MKSPLTKGEKMEKIKIFSGSSHPELAKEICRKLNIKLSPIIVQEYANGCFEVILREEVEGRTVFLIQTSLPETLHRDLWELLQMVSAAKENGASEIIVVMPYCSYARSDKIHAPGMTINAKLLVKLLETSGMKRFVGIDFHSKAFEKLFPEDVEVCHLSALYLIAGYLKTKSLLDGILLPGDEGNLNKAILLAQKLDLPVGVTRKKRIDDKNVVIEDITGEIIGNEVIVFDDEISPVATTLKALAKELKKRGAKSITVAVTHASFAQETVRSLQEFRILREIVVTDTVPIPEEAKRLLPLRVLSVAGLIAEKIREISEEP